MRTPTRSKTIWIRCLATAAGATALATVGVLLPAGASAVPTPQGSGTVTAATADPGPAIPPGGGTLKVPVLSRTPGSVIPKDGGSRTLPQQNPPFLFSYTFNGHLKLGGGYYTAGREVRLYVRYAGNGRLAYSGTAIAQAHPVTPGGAVYVETKIPAPCAPGNNGYAQAYDVATGRWSSRLPVTICQLIDNGPALHPVPE